MPDSFISGLDLDVVRKAVRVTTVQDYYWVFRGEIIAQSAGPAEYGGHIIVVPDDDVRVKCYTCIMITQGRLVYSDAQGYVVRVDACCESCYEVIRRLPAGTDREHVLRLTRGAALRRDYPEERIEEFDSREEFEAARKSYLSYLIEEVPAYARRRVRYELTMITQATRLQRWFKKLKPIPEPVRQQYFPAKDETIGQMLTRQRQARLAAEAVATAARAAEAEEARRNGGLILPKVDDVLAVAVADNVAAQRLLKLLGRAS